MGPDTANGVLAAKPSVLLGTAKSPEKMKKTMQIVEVDNGYLVSTQSYPYKSMIAKTADDVVKTVSELLSL